MVEAPLGMFGKYLARRLPVGNLTIVDHRGRRMRLGDGSGPVVEVRLTGPWTAAYLMRRPALHLGECYTDGSLRMEQGDIYDLLDLLGRNLEHQPRSGGGALRGGLMTAQRLIQQWNSRALAQRNVAHHYDLSTQLYRQFLDEDLQYSCAYFRDPETTLDQAQKAKKAHIAAKLLLKPGMRVLDIGCGWGGLGLSLAEEARVEVLGVTLSEQQLLVARERAAERRLQSRARFEMLDYRDVEGSFDRIVSVGMLEHVGRPNFGSYFETVARSLAEDGVALIHAIGHRGEPGLTNPWIAKYIFPGGYIPALSEVLPAIQAAGLWVTDIEVLRLHYAETLRCWRERLRQRRAKVVELYDERFYRMWEFYLACSEVAFRHLGHMVFQIQLTKTPQAAPLVRDYLYPSAEPVAQRARPSSVAA